MLDLQTHTYWSHITGTGLIGKLKGKKLRTIPVVQTTWKEWYTQHPNTRVLKKNKQIRSSHYARYFQDPTRIGIFRSQHLIQRLPPKELVIGVTRGPFAVAVVDNKLSRGAFVQTQLGDERILVARGLDDGVRAFVAALGDKNFIFHSGSEIGKIEDVTTHSMWDVRSGTCFSGPLQGQKLKEIPVTVAFWFAWSIFYPNTEVIDPIGSKQDAGNR